MNNKLARFHKNPLDRLLGGLFRPFDDIWLSDDLWNIPEIYGGPDIKMKETDEAIEVSVALPGVQKDEIKVSTLNGMLSISSESKSEFAYSSFSKSWSLPDNVDTSQIAAKHENGVLLLNIPKTKKPKEEENVVKIE